ncbi:MAG: glycoside hydrolase family 2 protein [Firmicutes bacterium]|nr:glycoside hydrolase family 2 protein [Bacillota bacterium]
MRKRYDLNDDWLFSEVFEDGMKELSYDEGAMTPVRLPHTVKETPFDYFDESCYQMVSGYRRRFTAPEEWRGKHVELTFGGAAHEAVVYVNGAKALTHACGYTAFTVDLTDRLNYGGENLIAVRLDSRESLNVPPFGYVIDYMTYGGLYREVFLEVTEKARLADVFLRTEGEPDAPELVTLPEIENPDGRDLRVRQQVQDGESVLFSREAVPETELRQAFPGVTLWSPGLPKLYIVRTELADAASGEILDRVDVPFGFRFAEFRADGFYLNGEKLKIVGLNRHQSYPYVGYAMPASMQAFDARILKEELGLNAVRTSHYPQSHAFLDACDELGLLVFTEIPGWQHIGDAAWQDQAVRNTEEMVLQYRNHPSIVLWGVRINESQDCDGLYARTNAAAHRLDPSRQTSGVRYLKKNSLLEDVCAYNDFLHSGSNPGCEPKKAVTSDMAKGYLVSEYCGHMYPTKSYDDEEQRTSHMLRHAKVLNDIAAETDIAGSFGWCFADYNTHMDFGSGDRICYHGVTDMFRNAKPAAAVYAVRGENTVLEVSSSMDIGEHPASNRGSVWIVSNADSVRMIKNGRLLKEYFPKDSPYKHLAHGPVEVDDFIGKALEESEGFPPKKAEAAKKVLNYAALHGQDHLPPAILAQAAKCIALYGMKPDDAVTLYQKYIGDWGGAATEYRFEAVKDGQVVKSVTKTPAKKVVLDVRVSSTELIERATYDVSAVRIRAVDEHDNVLPFFNEPLFFETDGPIGIIGPSVISLKGGMGGTYVKTLPGSSREASLTIRSLQAEPVTVRFTVKDARQAQL